MTENVQIEYPVALSDGDYLDFYKKYTKIVNLQERMGRMKAELALVEKQLQEERVDQEKQNAGLRQKYDLTDGDAVDLETGVITRSARPQPVRSGTLPTRSKKVASPVLESETDEPASEPLSS